MDFEGDRKGAKTLKEIIEGHGSYLNRDQRMQLGKRLSSLSLRNIGKVKEKIDDKWFKVRLYHRDDIEAIVFNITCVDDPMYGFFIVEDENEEFNQQYGL